MGHVPIVRFKYETEANPPTSGSSGAQPSATRWTAEAEIAPPIPIPAAGSSTTQSDSAAMISLVDDALGLWYFDTAHWMWTDSNGNPVFGDWAPRWIKHPMTLVPGGHAAVGAFGTSFDGQPSGANGSSDPFISTSGQGGSDDVVNPTESPVVTLVITWGSPVPPTSITNSGSSYPGDSYGEMQPLWASNYSQGITVGYRWYETWTGTPGNWSSVYGCIPCVAVYGSPVHFYEFPAASGGTTLAVELQNGALSLVVNEGGKAVVLGPYTEPTISLEKLFLSPQGFGSVIRGYYYFSQGYEHPEATIEAAAVFNNSAVETIQALAEATVVPGGGGRQVNGVRFKAEGQQALAIPGRLLEYSHYWPLDDASPGPMVDVLNGANLTVNDPADATFQADGVDPLHPQGTSVPKRSFRMGVSQNASTHLSAGSTLATIGPGGAGNDFSLMLWLAWEGPYPATDTSFLIWKTGSVTFGNTSEIASQGYIGWDRIAEPFGVGWDTWGKTEQTIDQLRSSGFDWPATIDGTIKTKSAQWAQVVFVYRTLSSTSVQKEIWIDGINWVVGPADPTGWGAPVSLLQVGGGSAGRYQDLILYPFALEASEIQDALVWVNG